MTEILSPPEFAVDPLILNFAFNLLRRHKKEIPDTAWVSGISLASLPIRLVICLGF